MIVRKKSRFHAGMETSSMSDIMFFLLLFFLIISTLANPNVIKVPLPSANQTDQTAGQHLTLTVTKEKRYYLDQEEVSIENLETRLKEEVLLRKDETVVLRPDKDLVVQDLIDILQMGLKNQVKMLISTQAG
jgi:biopolymer transport protein ExbD